MSHCRLYSGRALTLLPFMCIRLCVLDMLAKTYQGYAGHIKPEVKNLQTECGLADGAKVYTSAGHDQTVGQHTCRHALFVMRLGAHFIPLRRPME